MSGDYKQLEDSEEDLVRAFAKISQSRRATISEPGRLFSRQHTSATVMEGSEYRIVVLGSKATGKSCLICQLLYDSFPTDLVPTVEEMYRSWAEFDVDGEKISLNIQDTGGSYVDDFPAMVELSLQSADAVLLVFSVSDESSFFALARLREMAIKKSKYGESIPIVVVGNKTDIEDDEREVARVEVETKVMFQWNSGYMECSAKEGGLPVRQVFLELIHRVRDKGSSVSQDKKT